MVWPEDLKKISAEELAALHEENEAWGKDLRIRFGKDATNCKDMNEYRRRGRLLMHELSERSKRALRAGASNS